VEGASRRSSLFSRAVEDADGAVGRVDPPGVAAAEGGSQLRSAVADAKPTKLEEEAAGAQPPVLGAARVPGVRIAEPRGEGDAPARPRMHAGLHALPPDSPFAAEAGAEGRAWPILDHLVSLLATGQMAGGDGRGASGAGATTGHVLDAARLAKTSGSAGAALERGLVGSISSGALRAAYEGDGETARVWGSEAVGQLVAPSTAASRHPCIALPAAEAARVVDGAVAAAVKAAPVVAAAPAAVVLGKPAAGFGAGRGSMGAGGAAAAAASLAPSPAPAAPSLDAIRAVAIQLAEADYRETVGALAAYLLGPVVGGAPGGQLAVAPPRSRVPAAQALASASPAAARPPRLPHLPASLLPPRPHLLHLPAGEGGKGPAIDLHGRPVLVLGAGAGFAAAHLSSVLPNSTILAVSWGAIESSSELLTPAALSAALRRELGHANLWTADLGAAPESGSALASVLSFVQSWTREGPGGTAWKGAGEGSGTGVEAWKALQGALPDTARALEAAISQVRASKGRLPASPLPVDPLPGRFTLGAIALPSLSRLHGSSLPHEFEARIGALLSSSRTLLLPSALPDTRFFSYWTSTDALLRAGAAAAGLVIDIRTSGGLTVARTQSVEEEAYERALYERAGREAASPSAAAPGFKWSEGTAVPGMVIDFCAPHLLADASAAVASVATAAIRTAPTLPLPVLRAIDAALAQLLPVGGAGRSVPSRRGLTTPAHAALAGMPLPFALGLGLSRDGAADIAALLTRADVPPALLSAAAQADVALLPSAPVIVSPYALQVRGSGSRAHGAGASAVGSSALASGLASRISAISARAVLAESERKAAAAAAAKTKAKEVSTVRVAAAAKVGSKRAAVPRPKAAPVEAEAEAEAEAEVVDKEVENVAEEAPAPLSRKRQAAAKPTVVEPRVVAKPLRAAPAFVADEAPAVEEEMGDEPVAAPPAAKAPAKAKAPTARSRREQQAPVAPAAAVEAEDEEEAVPPPDSSSILDEEGAPEGIFDVRPASRQAPVVPSAEDEEEDAAALADAIGALAEASEEEEENAAAVPPARAPALPVARAKGPAIKSAGRGRMLAEGGGSIFGRSKVPKVPKAAPAKEAEGKDKVEAAEAEEEGPALPIVADTRWVTLRPVQAPPKLDAGDASFLSDIGSGGGKRIAAWAADLGSSQARLVDAETPSFRAWWRALTPELTILGSVAAGWSVLVQGCGGALLSAKLARSFPASTVVSVKGAGGDAARSHADLLRLLGASNNLLASSASALPLFSPESALAIAAGGDPFGLHLLGQDIWAALTAEALPLLVAAQVPGDGPAADLQETAARVAGEIAEAWESRLGALLRLGRSTVLHLQPWSQTLAPLRLVVPVCDRPCALLGAAFGALSAGGAAKDVDGDGFLELPRTMLGGGGSDDLFDSLLMARHEVEEEEEEEEEEGLLMPEEDGAGDDVGSLLDSLVAAGATEEEEAAAAAPRGSLFARKAVAGRGRSLLQLRGGKGKGGAAAAPAAFPVPATTTTTAPSFTSSLLPGANTLALAVLVLLEERYATPPSAAFDAPPSGSAALYGPYATLIAAAAHAAGLPDATGRFVSENAGAKAGAGAMFIRFDGGAALGALRPGVSLHTLLAAGLAPAPRARLAHLLLSLPLPAIVRGAVARGHSAGGSGAAGSPLTITPWDLRLMPDASASCTARLLLVLPAPARGSASRGKVARAEWSSPLCLRPAPGGDDPDQDSGSSEHGGVADGDTPSPGWEEGADAPTAVREAWAALSSQLHEGDTSSGGGPGRFSAVEYGSGTGSLSLALARSFPSATVLSIERDVGATDAHMAAALRGGIGNNVIAKGEVDAELWRRLHDSPEFFRFQVLSRDLIGLIARASTTSVSQQSSGLPSLRSGVGTLLALAATTFLRVPSAALLSLTLTIFGDPQGGYGGAGARVVSPGPSGGEYAGIPLQARPPCRRDMPSALFGAVEGSASPACGVGAGVPASLSALTLSAIAGGAPGSSFAPSAPTFALSYHPRPALISAELRLMSALVRAPLGTSIRVAAGPLPAPATVPLSMDDIRPPGEGEGPACTLGPAAAMQGQGPSRRSATWPWSSPVLSPWPALSSGWVRVDVANLTRHVNHHFQSDIDGHSRKYTLRVRVNATAGAALAAAAVAAGYSPAATSGLTPAAVSAVLAPGNHPNHGHTTLWVGARSAPVSGMSGTAPAVQVAAAAAAFALGPGTVLPGVSSIILTRDTDGALIPYDTVYGITLITGLRMGLLAPLRTRAYHQFVSLPLYQDMAPWNIVFTGPRLDYIDFDTKDRTYDAFVPRAYEVMEVLFNYKRTLEDFKRCGGKSSNPYGFPFVSDCVGSSFTGPCKDSKAPVPCGDGTCRSDYVTCLRALSDGSRAGELRNDLLWAFRSQESARKAESAALALAARQAGRGGDESEEEEEAAAEGGAEDGGEESGAVTIEEGREGRYLPSGAKDGADAYISSLFGRPGVDDKSAGTGRKAVGKGAGSGRASRVSRSSDLVAGVSRGTLEYGTDGVHTPDDE